MPYGDGTGPNGFGPMTGRAAGFCAGDNVPGYMNPVQGRGFRGGSGHSGRSRGGRGRGFGRGRGGFGWRHRYYATGIPGRERAGGVHPGAPWDWQAPPAAPVEPPGVEEELELLKRQARNFEGSLKAIMERINELESGPSEE